MLIARMRGILGAGEAEAHFEMGLSDPAGDQWPFERAQLRFDNAEWLRRRRRINDAKPVLTEALAVFRRLSARSWAERAEAEHRSYPKLGIADRRQLPDVIAHASTPTSAQ
jgi:hypothetical protein